MTNYLHLPKVLNLDTIIPICHWMWNMLSLFDLQQQVCSWSLKNFGHNLSKRKEYCNITDGQKYTFCPAIGPALYSTAALMGMAEELGELYQDGKSEDHLDACGDFMIYFLDYCGREGVWLSELVAKSDHDFENDKATADVIVAKLGKLFHCNLKCHQGIREFANPEYFIEQRNKAIIELFWALDAFVNGDFGKTTLEVASETWQEVVSKRNWVDDSKAGGGHTHEGKNVCTPSEDSVTDSN